MSAVVASGEGGRDPRSELASLRDLIDVNAKALAAFERALAASNRQALEMKRLLSELVELQRMLQSQTGNS